MLTEHRGTSPDPGPGGHQIERMPKGSLPGKQREPGLWYATSFSPRPNPAGTVFGMRIGAAWMVS